MKYEYDISAYGVELTFEGKPSETIRKILKGHGFRWHPRMKTWWRRRVDGAADMLGAIDKQIDQDAGIRRPDGKCWNCGDANGFFRPHGAAAPVHCDQCHSKLQRHESPFLTPTQAKGGAE